MSTIKIFKFRNKIWFFVYICMYLYLYLHLRLFIYAYSWYACVLYGTYYLFYISRIVSWHFARFKRRLACKKKKISSQGNANILFPSVLFCKVTGLRFVMFIPLFSFIHNIPSLRLLYISTEANLFYFLCSQEFHIRWISCKIVYVHLYRYIREICTIALTFTEFRGRYGSRFTTRSTE